MTKRTVISCIFAILLGLLLPSILSAQRGNIIIPAGASMTVPQGAVICADTIFANGTGHGSLTLADPSCLCSGSVVIPVELLSLSAEHRNGAIVLTWRTATETNNHGFEVQRQTKDGRWRALGFVAGQGTTTRPQKYDYIDDLGDLPHYSGSVVYRLRQIDMDGNASLLPQVEVRLSAPLPELAVEGYPVPCDRELLLYISFREEASVGMRLYDRAGQLCLTVVRDEPFGAGSHMRVLQTGHLPSGQYFLVVETDTDRRTSKVVVQH